MVTKIIWGICLAGMAYLNNKAVRWNDAKFKVMVNVFLAIITLIFVLQLFGVGL